MCIYLYFLTQHRASYIPDERAVKCDPTHTNNYCNFGLFLSEEKKQYRQAEEMYRHALKISPKHSNSLYNYAVMLDTHCNRKPEAESLYRGALAVDPRHSYALYNLAVLLEEIAIDRDGENSIQEIAKLYKAATDIDPRDPASAADYGRFILVRFDDFEHAEPHLLRALGMDDENEVALYNLALLYHKYKPQSSSSAEDGNIKVALEMYRRLVAKNSQHLSGLLQLARLLVEVNSTVGKENSTATNAFADGADGFSDASVVVTNSTTSGKVVDSSKVARAWMEEVIELYEAVIPRHKEPDAVVCEFTKVVNKYGSARQKMRAIATAEAYMRSREERSGAGKDKGDSDNEYSEVYSSDISRVMEIMKKSTNK